MSKRIFLFCFILLFTFSLSGCKMSEADIREKAYRSLPESVKETVIDWKNAEVEECRMQDDYYIDKPKGSSLKNRNVYIVTFSTTDDYMTGPITIYMDKNTYEVLGYGLSG